MPDIPQDEAPNGLADSVLLEVDPDTLEMPDTPEIPEMPDSPDPGGQRP
jgi:hypothetical protein